MHLLILIFYAFQAPITLSKIPSNSALASYCTVNQPLSKEHQSEGRDMRIPACAVLLRALLTILTRAILLAFAFHLCGTASVLVCLLLLWQMPWPKPALGRKGLILLRDHCLSLKEAKAGTQGRNMKQKPQGSCAYWPVLSGLLNYLSYLAHTHLPRDGAAHSGLGPATAVNN